MVPPVDQSTSDKKAKLSTNGLRGLAKYQIRQGFTSESLIYGN
jgi:hypothetical protein